MSQTNGNETKSFKCLCGSDSYRKVVRCGRGVVRDRPVMSTYDYECRGCPARFSNPEEYTKTCEEVVSRITSEVEEKLRKEGKTPSAS